MYGGGSEYEIIGKEFICYYKNIWRNIQENSY